MHIFEYVIVSNCFIYTEWLLILMNFIVFMTYFSLNELARDLEDPFVFDPNDLPILKMQYAFNERMLAIARAHRYCTLSSLINTLNHIFND